MPPPLTIGRYQIAAEIGRGGMATVYRAFDPLVKREVAIKFLPREFLHNPTFRARFEQEARAVATLEHPAIVPIYDFGEEDGQPFLVMRLLTGGSLSERLQHGPLPLAEAARIIMALAPGLDQAHAMGIIHRDLKPANILFDTFNNPHLSDFGLVKLMSAEDGHAQDSGMFGTPEYMAPEMAQRGRIGKAIDIYALGVTLYEMLTGKPPYAADTTVGLLMAHASQPVPELRDSLPDLPDSAQDVLRRAMAKEPTDRYPSAGEMAADLEAIAATGKTQKLALLRRDKTPQLDEADFARLRQRPRPARAILGMAVAALIVGGIALVVFGGGLFAAAPGPASPTAGDTPASTSGQTGSPSETAPASAPTSPASPQPTRSPNAITLDTIRFVQPIRRLAGHTSLVNAVAWSPDGALASASADKTVMLWNASTGEPVATLAGHSNWVQGLAFSPDGRLLASASSDHSAILWDVASRQPVRTIKTPLYGLNGVAWSPDGQRLALSPYYINPLLYSVETGQIIRELKDHTYQVNTVAFSPDGATLASGASDARIILWDAVTGDPIRALVGHSRTVLSVAWSPLIREIASGSEDQRVIVWDADSGQVELKLPGHRDQVNSVGWSPDGQIIASGSADGTIRLWNAESGDLLRVLDGSAGPVQSVAWSPDGAWLASAMFNGTVILWGIAP